MEQNFNRVTLCGTVAEQAVLSHVNHEVPFYRFTLDVERLSGQVDSLHIIVSQQQWEAAALTVGDTVSLTGQLRSFNNKSGEGSRLVISVFARTLEKGGASPINIIQLSGILCKTPSIRSTPLGREICDITLAVNRRYGRADYLPCIAWGAVAQEVSRLHVGARLTVEGRVQSREYTKTTPAGIIHRTAYEVSIMRPAEVEEFLL